MRHGGNVWDEARPEDWLDYSANLRPEGTPDWVAETLRRAVADTRYYPDRHMRMARQGLAAALGFFLGGQGFPVRFVQRVVLKMRRNKHIMRIVRQHDPSLPRMI